MRIIAVSVVKLFSKPKYMLGVQEEAPAKIASFHSSCTHVYVLIDAVTIYGCGSFRGTRSQHRFISFSTRLSQLWYISINRTDEWRSGIEASLWLFEALHLMWADQNMDRTMKPIWQWICPQMKLIDLFVSLLKGPSTHLSEKINTYKSLLTHVIAVWHVKYIIAQIYHCCCLSADLRALFLFFLIKLAPATQRPKIFAHPFLIQGIGSNQ